MVNINGYNFEGPWILGQAFRNVPGVYVVYTSRLWLDVGETDALGNRINGENHDRKPNWIRNSGGLPINIAFLNVGNSDERLRIESALRLFLCPVCGDR